MFNFKRATTANLLDKYYTKPPVARACIELIKKPLAAADFIIEPAAGNGVFLRALPGHKHVGLDLAPEGPDIKRGNWFDYQVPPDYNNVAVVGNPPFGVNNALSRDFILHALRFPNVKTIAFILPHVYKKHTQQKILPAAWRIALIHDLPAESFTCAGVGAHIPCAFFVFSRTPGTDLRFDPQQHQEAVDFRWGTKNNFDFFMFGAAPRKLVTTVHANNRGYYLQAKIPPDVLRHRIQQVPWEGNSSAAGGVYWLTKPEIIFQYNRYYGPKPA